MSERTAEELTAIAQREAQEGLAKVQAMISKLEPLPQARVHVIADILRDLINAEDGGHEAELAFTLVLAERAAL